METTIQSSTLSRRWAALVTALFVVASAIGISNHQIWLDEAQHFLIGRQSNTLGNLYTNMRYDGHVRLWNYLLYFITHFIYDKPLGMQVFHLAIISSAVFVFLRFAPLAVSAKLLIISGYYFLFEYNEISRNYALGILMLFICCHLLKNINKNVWWIGLLMFLMSNTHLFFCFAAAGIFMNIWLRSPRHPGTRTALFVAGIFLLLSVATVAIQIQIPADNGYFHPELMDWTAHQNLVAPLYGFVKGLLPVPAANYGDFWNHFTFDNLSPFLKLPIAIALLIFTNSIFRKSPGALVFFCCGTALLLLFLYLGQSRAARYFGIFFIFFIATAWLASYEGLAVLATPLLRQSSGQEKIRKGILYAILIANLATGIYAYTICLRRPFTESASVAKFITRQNAQGQPVIVEGYGALPTLSAYLGIRLYCLDIDQFGSYCIWKKSLFKIPQPDLAIELQQSTYVWRLNNFILVSLRPFPRDSIICRNVLFRLQFLSDFKKAIIRPDYYVYQVTMKKIS